MTPLSQVLKLILEILLVLGFVGLVFIYPLYLQYRQFNNWKEISAEYGFQCMLHLMYPEMKGVLRGHSILFQNKVEWERSVWSRLQIWIQLRNEAPFRFIIYQKGNNCYRPPTMGELEVQGLSLDYLGERFALESKTPLQKSLPLRDQHLINLFTAHKCVGLAVDGVKLYFERNDITYSVEELKKIMEELITLAESLER